jgi:cysteine synthase
VWFEHRKETDWRITADKRAVRAARAALADQGWITGGSATAVLAALG